MKSAWTKGLTGDAKTEREKKVKSFSTAFKELTKVLEDVEPQSEVTDYSEGWQHRQAHRNGELAMLKRVKELLEINK